MTHFSLTALPAIRYASDMPFAVGMVLADEHGSTTEVRAVGRTCAVLASYEGHRGVDERVIRRVYPYLVFVTEMVADAEAREAERVEALAEAAQHEDDMRQEVLDRAAAEWARKNPPSMRTVYEARSMNRVEDFDSRDEARAFVEGRGVGSVTTFVVRPNNPGLLPAEVHNSCAHDVFADGAWRGIDLTR